MTGIRSKLNRIFQTPPAATHGAYTGRSSSCFMLRLFSNRTLGLLVLIQLSQCNLGFSTDCKTVTFDQEYANSDMVFLGRVVELNDSYYKIKVIENYKMEISDTLIGKLIDGEEMPRKGSYWLIYAHGDRTTFSITECSGSKSLDRPFGFHDFAFPSPPPKYLNDNKALQEIFWDLQKSKSLNEFYFEISSLRELSRKKEIESLKSNIALLRDQNSDLVNLVRSLQSWVIGIAIFSGLLIALQLYRLISK